MDEQQASLDYLINQVWLFFFFRIVLLLYVYIGIVSKKYSCLIFFMFRNLFSAYYVRDTIVKCRQTESNNQKRIFT